MSKIHTLRDLPSNNSESYGFNVERRGQSSNQCMNCLQAVFPGFRLVSITMLLSVICVGMYITTKVVDETVMGNSGGDLQRWICTLHTFQAKYTYDITHRYEVWRLFTAVFLHNSFLHLFWNVFSILMIGFTVEQ